MQTQFGNGEGTFRPVSLLLSSYLAILPPRSLLSEQIFSWHPVGSGCALFSDTAPRLPPCSQPESSVCQCWLLANQLRELGRPLLALLGLVSEQHQFHSRAL